MKKALRCCLLSAALVAAVGFVSPSFAEESNPLLQVRIIEVKPDRVGEFWDLQKEMRDKRVATGQDARGVWRESRGAVNVFHIVEEHDNFASFDDTGNPVMEKDEWARWLARIQDTIDSHELVNIKLYADLRIPPAEEKDPKLLMLRYRTVAAGKIGTMEDWLSEKLVPALRDANESGITFGRITLGGNPRTFISASRFDVWNEMDEPGPFADMSDEESEAFFAEYNECVVDARNLVLRYVPALSHKAPEELASTD
ncbi:hypothetical protein [Pelagicoccus mobilis]|uniref:NIPSNAP domain-containing protein n=1 Tax=Pelagicoccus mobilis TaxID=415221 RepID=A0A934RWR7_9BACT|nr:hypothetical protein [Pelagicoccus mobilis]MBK1876196.1 hypothetical protein [Pelagicoccus mobilis]